MKITLFYIFSILHITTYSYAVSSHETLIADEKVKPDAVKEYKGKDYPGKYRTTNQPLSDKYINSKGLENLYASGSNQPTENQLNTIIEDICLKTSFAKDQIYIIDLRQEHHLFINGKPFTEFTPCFGGNAGKTTEQILKGEKELGDRLRTYPFLYLHKVMKKFDCQHVGESQVIQENGKILTEKEMAERLGVNYIRFSVQDHFTPDPEIVDQFIAFIKSLPQNNWLHFHCRGGKGRTATFMVMYDILKNHPYIAFEDFFKRQVALGGKDLSKNMKDIKTLKAADLNRFNFIHHFYTYVMAIDGYRQSTWSEWLKIHPLTLIP